MSSKELFISAPCAYIPVRSLETAHTAHVYTLVYDAEHNTVSYACSCTGLSAPAEVTFSAGEGTGTMALSAEDFAYSNGFVLTLPENTFIAPEGEYFYAWSVGNTEYFPGETVTFTDAVAVAAVWAPLYVEATESEAYLHTFGSTEAPAYSVSEVSPMTLTATLSGSTSEVEGGTDAFWAGIYVQVVDNGVTYTFRPDNYWFSSIEGDNARTPSTPGRVSNTITNGALGTADEFFTLKTSSSWTIRVVKQGTDVTVTFSIGDTFELQYGLHNVAEGTSVVYFLVDGAAVTANDVAITVSSVQSTSFTVGNVAAGYDDNAWLTSIKKGEKLVITGDHTSRGQKNWEEVGIGLFGSTPGLVPAAYFRGDNFVNEATSADGNATHDVEAESWHITKAFTHSGDWDVFKQAVKDCSIEYTIDWTQEDKIVITMLFTDASEAEYKQTYTVTTAAAFADSYTISLGSEYSAATITNVTRTHA